MKRLNSVNWEEEETNLLQELILELVKLLCRSRKWVQRQSFASLAGHLVSSNAIEPTEFAQNILPHLISLSDDKVPNVRFMVAQVLSSLINLGNTFQQWNIILLNLHKNKFQTGFLILPILTIQF